VLRRTAGPPTPRTSRPLIRCKPSKSSAAGLLVQRASRPRQLPERRPPSRAATATIAVYDDNNSVDYQQPIDEPDGTAVVTSPDTAPTYVLPDAATVRTFTAQSARTPRGYTTPAATSMTPSDTAGSSWKNTIVGVFNPRNGHIESVVAIKVKMRIDGNTSDYWRFDVSLHEKYGPAYTMDAYLDCGVDITGDQDRICHGHHYSDGSTDGAYAGSWQTLPPAMPSRHR
jgi:hypothetical protein